METGGQRMICGQTSKSSKVIKFDNLYFDTRTNSSKD